MYYHYSKKVIEIVHTCIYHLMAIERRQHLRKEREKKKDSRGPEKIPLEYSISDLARMFYVLEECTFHFIIIFCLFCALRFQNQNTQKGNHSTDWQFFLKAASGIGKACGLNFAEAGAKGVCFADIDQNGVQEAAHASKNYATHPEYHAIAVEVNVTDPESVQAMVDRVVSEFGRIDHCVNSAGVRVVFPLCSSGTEVISSANAYR